MKKIVMTALVTAFCLGVWAISVLAIKIGEAKIQLPVGTKVEQVTRFRLTDGVIELINTKEGFCVTVYDEKGKLVHTGKQARILRGKKGKETSIDKIRKMTKIDDEVVWLSFTLGPAGVIVPDPPYFPGPAGVIVPDPPH